jgi:glycosyltransferase involved in cell wall biosynthesis
MIRCTIGVMAYNEEQNIVQALYALLNQQLITCDITEIIVVASGCTDRTVEFAQQVAQAYPRVRVEVQAERAGKAAAINHLIKIARESIIVLAGADTLPDPLALEYLVHPFLDPDVGMTGARVVPLNDPQTFLGLTTQILWRVHHRMALRWPKLGELVAFRNVGLELPINSATDEVALEALMSTRGYRLVYAPDAVVYNRGPQTLPDFLNQRRRIFAGHLHIAATFGYMAASMHPGHLVFLAIEAGLRYSFLLLFMMGAIVLEVWARILGTLDFLFGQSHHIWKPIRSTKRVQPEQRPLTIVILKCGPGVVRPARLVRRMRRIPAAEGVLFWWSQKRRQVLFMLPTDETTSADFEARLRQLTAYIAPRRSPDGVVVAHDIVRFSSVLTGNRPVVPGVRPADE